MSARKDNSWGVANSLPISRVASATRQKAVVAPNIQRAAARSEALGELTAGGIHKPDNLRCIVVVEVVFFGLELHGCDDGRL
jgi:predicted cation transporter